MRVQQQSVVVPKHGGGAAYRWGGADSEAKATVYVFEGNSQQVELIMFVPCH